MREKESQLPTISMIVPTRNEAANIRPLLARLSSALNDLTVEILFVDDSTDDTAAEIAHAAADFPQLTIRWLVRPPEKQNGLSGAVVDGLHQVRGEWVGVMDADLQHPPEMVRQLYRHSQETGADMIVGSRQGTLFGPLGLSRARAFTSQMLTILARALFPQILKNVSDPLTGLFLVRREKVNPTVLRPDGFKILLEILVRTPDLRVSELHFDFAQRHSGQSKADFREGMRFFRHLLRLRLTANGWFVRYVVVRVLGFVWHLFLLWLLVGKAGLSLLLGEVVAAELTIFWNFWLTDHWVFTDADGDLSHQRLSRFWLANQLYLLMRLPVLYGLAVWAGWHYLWAAAVAVALIGFVKYGASEQWIWNRGLSWQRPYHHYNIHGLIGVESQVLLPDLAYFRTDKPLDKVDIRLRVDRHGTPSHQPGAIAFHEAFGRFGFGVAVMPAPCTEVVVSPVMERAPFVLYKSVLEPLLRWRLSEKGVVLLPGAAAVADEAGTLVLAHTQWPKTRAVLDWCLQTGGSFLGDDGVFVQETGVLLAFPRPISMTRQTAVLVGKGKIWARLKALLYAVQWRRLGIWLSTHRWPIATLNVLAQRLVAPPKTAVSKLQPPVGITASAPLTQILYVEEENRPNSEVANKAKEMLEQAKGFPPYGLLLTALSNRSGLSILEREQAVLQKAFASARLIGPEMWLTEVKAGLK
jgi:glycosyltransferase involved in cell wall biosynthesis